MGVSLYFYHLIARSEHGLMIQILAGLITYLLLAIYCHEQHNEKVNIKIHNELVESMEERKEDQPPAANKAEPDICQLHAIF